MPERSDHFATLSCRLSNDNLQSGLSPTRCSGRNARRRTDRGRLAGFPPRTCPCPRPNRSLRFLPLREHPGNPPSRGAPSRPTSGGTLRCSGSTTTTCPATDTSPACSSPTSAGLRAHRGRHPEGRDEDAGVPCPEPQRPHSGAGARGRRLHRRVERDPLLPRGGLALSSLRPAGPRPHPPVDVLRAIQPRALHRGRTPLDTAPRDDGGAAVRAAGPAERGTGARSRRRRCRPRAGALATSPARWRVFFTPRVAARAGVFAPVEAAEMLDVPAVVALPVQRLGAHHLIDRRTARRDLAPERLSASPSRPSSS